MIWAIALAASPADWTKLPANVKPAVEDAYIDQTAADLNYGRSEVLISGLGKTILIRPSNLSFLVPQGQKIKSASLLLSTSEPIAPEITDIGLITAPWFEGPGRANGLKPSELEGGRWAVTWNHSRAGDAGAKWHREGGSGEMDREPITGTTSTFELGAFAINGLGPALQKMVDNPGRYTGICFTTKGRAQFLSSEFGAFGPMFQIETEASPKADGPDLEVVEISQTGVMRSSFPNDGQSLTWEARIRNNGNQASSAASGQWVSRYSDATAASVPAIQPGAETVVKLDFPFRADADKRFWPLSFTVALAGDTNPRDNFAEIAVGAVPVAVVEGGQPAGAETQAAFRRLVDLGNSHVFPMSRFSFAPEGVTERVRYVSDPNRAMAVIESSALEAAPFRALTQAILNLPAGFFTPPLAASASGSHLGITPDTRDEWGYPSGAAYPEHLWPPRGRGQFLLPESGLLGRTESALMMNLAGKSGTDRSPSKMVISNVVILYAYDGGGRPIRKAKVTLYQPKDGALGNPVFTGETSSTGAVLVSGRSFTDKRESFFGPLGADGTNSWIFAEFESQGEKATRWISWAKLVEEAKRGGRGASTLEYRMLLSDQPIDRAQNLVTGKSIEDSASRFPAALTAAIDDNVKTSIEVPGEPAWVEIDLGRDRAIGEIEIVFEGDAAWDSFAIMVYNTSQQPEQSRNWIDEEYGAMRATVQGQPKDGLVRLRYLGGSTNARYLRVLKRKGTAKLAEVIVRPVVGG